MSNLFPATAIGAFCLSLSFLAACRVGREAAAGRKAANAEAQAISPAPPQTHIRPAELAGSPNPAYADLVYLASDTLRGRRTGTPGNEKAAVYLAAALRKAGAVPVGARGSMSVAVPLLDRDAFADASLRFGDSRYRLPDGLLPLTWTGADVAAAVVYQTPAQLATPGGEVSGKIVVTEAGGGEAGAPLEQYLALTRERAASLWRAGALAPLEVYRSPALPFSRLVGALNRASMTIEGDPPVIPVAYVKAGAVWDDLRRGNLDVAQAQLRIVAPRVERITSHNIVAVLPGTDANVANEYIAVTAHFDHIGVTARPGLADSINNGARDNAMGTAALLEVARRWRDRPGRRPLLLMAWTAEEEGLLGSRYWTEHPTVPLEQVVFNFNMDGAGYTDTTAVVFNGYGFTRAQAVIDAAIVETGLSAREDPVPQYGLYRQSDNYSFAQQGVLAVNMAPGFEGFTDELMRYFHQPADEAAAVSPTYLQKYADAAVAAVRAIANAEAEALQWNGDSDALSEFVDLPD